MTQRSFLAFRAARNYVRTLKLRTRDDWRKRLRDTAFRQDLANRGIPSRPDRLYRETGWTGWNDWLGSNRFMGKPFMPYERWLAWVRDQGFSKKQDYGDWCERNSRKGDQDTCERERLGVPSSPASVYATFPGWRSVLGQSDATRGGQPARTYAPFRVARAFARSLKLNTAVEWRRWAREHASLLAEHGCPATPDRVAEYRADFRGWDDFLHASAPPAANRKRG